MKYIIDVQEKDHNSIINELKEDARIQSLTLISQSKAEILTNLKEALAEFKDIENGKIEARSVEKLIDEL